MIKAVIFDMYETLITLYESPLYFGEQIAKDAGIPVFKFQELWRPTETGRAIGQYTFEGLLEQILKECDCYTEEKHRLIVKKRIACKEEAFKHLHQEIIMEDGKEYLRGHTDRYIVVDRQITTLDEHELVNNIVPMTIKE